MFLHLTNYSINKASEDFIRDEETGSKRYAFVMTYFCIKYVDYFSVIQTETLIFK